VNSSDAPFFGLIFLCLIVSVRSALAIGVVRRFDFLDDDINQSPTGLAGEPTSRWAMDLASAFAGVLC